MVEKVLKVLKKGHSGLDSPLRAKGKENIALDKVVRLG